MEMASHKDWKQVFISIWWGLEVLKNGEENEQKKLTDCWTSAFDSTVEARESDAE